MTSERLWIFETRKPEYLQDCKNYNVYGVADPSYKELLEVQETDICLLRLKNTNAKYAYIGPFRIVSKIPDWAKFIERKGIWQKIRPIVTRQPIWLNRFPWCVFFEIFEDTAKNLKSLSYDKHVEACKLIKRTDATEIINSLVQDDYFPDKKIQQYRTVRGVWVKSRAEYMIDNWFAEHGIVTYYEKQLYLSQKIVPDWYIPEFDIYVEFLGLRGQTDYDNRWKEKNKLYKKYDIRCYTLDDDDLSDLDKSIPAKIPQLKERLR